MGGILFNNIIGVSSVTNTNSYLNKMIENAKLNPKRRMYSGGIKKLPLCFIFTHQKHIAMISKNQLSLFL